MERVFYEQPIETRVRITEKQNAKGDMQPEVEICVNRMNDAGENIEHVIHGDVMYVLTKVKECILALRELK